MRHKIEPFVYVFTLFNILFDSLPHYRNYARDWVCEDGASPPLVLEVLRDEIKISSIWENLAIISSSGAQGRR